MWLTPFVRSFVPALEEGPLVVAEVSGSAWTSGAIWTLASWPRMWSAISRPARSGKDWTRSLRRCSLSGSAWPRGGRRWSGRWIPSSFLATKDSPWNTARTSGRSTSSQPSTCYISVCRRRKKLDAAGASRSSNANIAEIYDQVLMLLGTQDLRFLKQQARPSTATALGYIWLWIVVDHGRDGAGCDLGGVGTAACADRVAVSKNLATQPNSAPTSQT